MGVVEGGVAYMMMMVVVREVKGTFVALHIKPNYLMT